MCGSVQVTSRSYPARERGGGAEGLRTGAKGSRENPFIIHCRCRQGRHRAGEWPSQCDHHISSQVSECGRSGRERVRAFSRAMASAPAHDARSSGGMQTWKATWMSVQTAMKHTFISLSDFAHAHLRNQLPFHQLKVHGSEREGKVAHEKLLRLIVETAAGSHRRDPEMTSSGTPITLQTLVHSTYTATSRSPSNTWRPA